MMIMCDFWLVENSRSLRALRFVHDQREVLGQDQAEAPAASWKGQQSWALSVFFNFFNNRKWFICIFKNKVNNLFLQQSYLKRPLPVKLT